MLSVLTYIVPFVAGIVLYGRWKRKFAVVVPANIADVAVNAPAADKDEKAVVAPKAELIDVPAVARDIEQVDEASTARSSLTSLLLWALVMLPTTIAGWYMIVFDLADRDSDASSIWYNVYLSGIAIMPATAALQILLYGVLSQLQDRGEHYHLLIRCAVLDGVIIPPLLAIWLVSMYPGRFIDGSIWTGVGVAAFASQAVVWMQFFLRSKRESERMMRIRPAI